MHPQRFICNFLTNTPQTCKKKFLCLNRITAEVIPLYGGSDGSASGGRIVENVKQGGILPSKVKEKEMLKIRLTRLGAKKQPSYRIIVVNSTTKRETRPIATLGHYNPKTKEMKFDKAAALEWIKKGAQPTERVQYLIKHCNEDGTLNYVKKETVKLSKKALAKKQAEEEAAAKAAEEAAKAEETSAPAEAETAEAPAEETTEA